MSMFTMFCDTHMSYFAFLFAAFQFNLINDVNN